MSELHKRRYPAPISSQLSCLTYSVRFDAGTIRSVIVSHKDYISRLFVLNFAMTFWDTGLYPLRSSSFIVVPNWPLLPDIATNIDFSNPGHLL